MDDFNKYWLKICKELEILVSTKEDNEANNRKRVSALSTLLNCVRDDQFKKLSKENRAYVNKKVLKSVDDSYNPELFCDLLCQILVAELEIQWGDGEDKRNFDFIFYSLVTKYYDPEIAETFKSSLANIFSGLHASLLLFEKGSQDEKIQITSAIAAEELRKTFSNLDLYKNSTKYS